MLAHHDYAKYLCYIDIFRVKNLALGPNSGGVVVVGFEPANFWSEAL